MAIDDPIQALNKQLELEDASASPITRAVIDLVKSLPLPWPLNTAVNKISENMATDSEHRREVLLKTICEEIARLGTRKEIQEFRAQMTPEQLNERTDTSARLLVDGARRASVTRSIERVKRIAVIIAHGVTEPKDVDEDEIEEMMRIAGELGNQDIAHLREIVGINGDALRRNGRIGRYDAFKLWERGRWGTKIDPEIDSVFSKLESYGLVARIPPPNNLNITADFQNRYVLLPKGLRFSELIDPVA